MSLDHWAISQAATRSGPVSSGVVNAGWNLLEMDGLYRSQRGAARMWTCLGLDARRAWHLLGVLR